MGPLLLRGLQSCLQHGPRSAPDLLRSNTSICGTVSPVSKKEKRKMNRGLMLFRAIYLAGFTHWMIVRVANDTKDRLIIILVACLMAIKWASDDFDYRLRR